MSQALSTAPRSQSTAASSQEVLRCELADQALLARVSGQAASRAVDGDTVLFPG
jgi:hypothetical protein